MNRAAYVVGVFGVVITAVTASGCDEFLVPCYGENGKIEDRGVKMDGDWALELVNGKPFVLGQPVPDTEGLVTAIKGEAYFNTTYTSWKNDCSRPIYSRGTISADVTYRALGTTQSKAYMATYELNHENGALTITVPRKNKADLAGAGTVTFNTGNGFPRTFTGSVPVDAWGINKMFQLTFKRSLLSDE